jgi:hypothetical protein
VTPNSTHYNWIPDTNNIGKCQMITGNARKSDARKSDAQKSDARKSDGTKSDSRNTYAQKSDVRKTNARKSNVIESDKTNSSSSSSICGIIPVQWYGQRWAISCHFEGNDLTQVRGPGDICTKTCDETPGKKISVFKLFNIISSVNW